MKFFLSPALFSRKHFSLGLSLSSPTDNNNPDGTVSGTLSRSKPITKSHQKHENLVVSRTRSYPYRNRLHTKVGVAETHIDPNLTRNHNKTLHPGVYKIRMSSDLELSRLKSEQSEVSSVFDNSAADLIQK